MKKVASRVTHPVRLSDLFVWTIDFRPRIVSTMDFRTLHKRAETCS